MTISRSDVTLVAALLAGVTTGTVAQTPPAVQRPIQQAQQAAQPSDASQRVQITSGGNGGVSMGSSATPASHTVAPGETLWALAQQYLGDPMLWPEIYRLNTNVVEDPHWIYPGEELRLTPDGPTMAGDTTVIVQQSVTVTPSADTIRPQPLVTASMNGPTIFSSQGSRFRRSNTYELMSQRAYRAVREGEYFSSGFLTENQPLPAGRIISNANARAAGRVNESAQQYNMVVFDLAPGETVQAGDVMLAFRRGDEVGIWGEVIEPTGLLRVKGPAGDKWMAQIVAVYQPIIVQQEVLKIQPFVNNSSQRAQRVAGGIEGHVIRLRNDHDVAQLQNVFFIDKGANDGIRLGDVFQLYATRVDQERGGTVEQDQGRAIIVSTRAGTSTAVIIELYRGDIGPQSLVRQIRRMPS